MKGINLVNISTDEKLPAYINPEKVICVTIRTSDGRTAIDLGMSTALSDYSVEETVALLQGKKIKKQSKSVAKRLKVQKGKKRGRPSKKV